MYAWLLDALEREYDLVRVLKESPPGQRAADPPPRHGAEVYPAAAHRQCGGLSEAASCSCRHLPTVLEVASAGRGIWWWRSLSRGIPWAFCCAAPSSPRRRTRAIGIQLCRALWVLHSMAAVHRDIKPENVILRGADAVLIDFDAARLHKPEHETDTQVLGTTGFAAPEQYGLSQSDTRTDIYSMGILINVMLTGEHPSRKLAEGRLGRVVERCTRVNPQKRYKNVLRLMEAL